MPPPSDAAACDVLVIGSGSAALTAALVTSARGRRTLIAEKTNRLGGTTALSGAAIWVPGNHHARAAGLDDGPEDALAYLRAAAPPGWQATEDPLWQAMAHAAGPMLAFVEAASPLRFELTPQADPLGDLPGAKPRGRMLSTRPLPRRLAREWRAHLRPPLFPHLYTFNEALAADLYHRPLRAAWRYAPRLILRALTGRRAKGTALVVGLLRGCLDHGCQIMVQARATSLVIEDGAVCGAVLADGRRIRARAVVLASGGFEWDAARTAAHFPGPIGFRSSPRGNEGDALRLAEAAGAALAHLDQANFAPAVPTTYEGQKHGLSIYFHQEPGAILVDGSGRRFACEAAFNLGEILDRRDPATGAALHQPAWLIADRSLLRRSPVLAWYMRKAPGWLLRASSLAELAQRADLLPAALEETIRTWNAACDIGHDVAFGRTRHHGGLAPIMAPPFVALPFNRSFMSTKGGPRTNARGQVLRPDGSVIAGLYCAGVAMANPIGTRAVGAGTTIGPNMVWGYLCGRSILDD